MDKKAACMMVEIMKMIRKTILFWFFCIISSSFAHADENFWTVDFEAAKLQAAKENKSLFVYFTGSDWCGFCVEFEKNILSQDLFKTAVKDKFIWVKMDDPNDKSKMSEKTIALVKKLNDEYDVQGPPTVMLTDAKGRPFTETGYDEGLSPERFVDSLNKSLAAHGQRNIDLQNAAKLEGTEKAKALIEALGSLELREIQIKNYYGTELAEIKKADPEDTSGFVKNIEMAAKIVELDKTLVAYEEAGDHKAALELLDKVLAEEGYSDEAKLSFLINKAKFLLSAEDFDNSLKALDEAQKFDTDGQTAKTIAIFKQTIIMAKKQKEKTK